MKTVTLKLICKECGHTFTHSKSVRGNGDTYKYWAMNNIRQCPKCYSLGKRKSSVDAPVPLRSGNKSSRAKRDL